MMGRIILTGDIHGDISRILNIDDTGMTKEDIVIVLGDFGVLWNDEERVEYVLQALGMKKFRTAFLDGNHENFTMIKNKETIVSWKGGSAGLLLGGVIHLLRGEIYDINGKRIGVCGGANSVDLWHRTEGISWWREEEITDADIDNFKNNLLRNSNEKGNKIDIMLSHDAPASIIPLVKLFSGVNGNKISNSQMQLEKINEVANVDKWYFGHWHINQRIDNKFECLYNSFREL